MHHLQKQHTRFIMISYEIRNLCDVMSWTSNSPRRTRLIRLYPDRYHVLIRSGEAQTSMHLLERPIDTQEVLSARAQPDTIRLHEAYLLLRPRHRHHTVSRTSCLDERH
jgi:hypothetical protein